MKKFKRRNSGFTLIEATLVIILLGIVAVVSIDSMTGSLSEDKFEATLQEMKTIRNALVGDPTIMTGGVRSSFGYLGDLGGLPTAVQGLAALVTNPGLPVWAMNATVRFGLGWNGPYINNADSGSDITKDAWGNSYIYSPAASPPTLVSRGSDGAVGGTGFAQDITIQITDNVYKSAVSGVILSNGAQWSGAAQVEMNYPDGNGGLTQVLQNIVAGDNGAFTIANVPVGLRSATVYVPTKAAATTTLGPYIFAVEKNDQLIPTTFNMSNGYNLEVPIEIIDSGISSSNAATVTFDRSVTNLDTAAYNGTIVYRFEAVCSNSDAVNRTLDLVDNGGTARASLTLTPTAGTYTRFVATWTPVAGSNDYKLRTPITTAGNDVTCYTARILVHQTNATITKIYIPLVSDDAATGASNVNTTAGNPVDTTTTRNAYLQPTTKYYSIFRKDVSRYATIAAVNPWTLDVVLASQSGNPQASLFNIGTGNQVTASECSGGATVARCTSSFANAAANFTDTSEFELRIQRQGGPPGDSLWLYKAGLWVALTSATKADVYYRIGKYFQAGANTVSTTARAMIDTSRYLSPLIYHEAVGYESTVGTSDLTLNTQGTSDSTSVGGSIAGSSFNPGTTTKTRTRSAAITITSGDRFLPRANVTTGVFDTVNDFIVVEVQ
jgi:type II secretion system protein G